MFGIPFLAPVAAWFKGYALVLILVGAACLMAWLGLRHYEGLVKDISTATYAIAQQSQQISDLQTDLGKVKDSNAATLATLKTLSENVAKVDEQARKRFEQTSKKIKAILESTTLTPEEKDRETSRVYAENLRASFCAYAPAKCPQEKKP